MCKISTDGRSELRTYDAFNRLAIITGARSVVKTYTYDVDRGLLLSDAYSDEKNNRTYMYNFLAMPVQISDDAEVKNLVYNSFNELEIREGCKPSYKDHPCLWLITWDPTQPVATRPLAIQKDGTCFCFGWDLTKNICEIFGQNGYIRSTYAYIPCGSVTASGDINQPIQWSSEYYDNELALVYYNYRHYNPTDGRWINRDPIAEQGGRNLYAFVENLCHSIDFRGLNEIIVSGGCNLNPYGLNVYTIYWYTDMQYYRTHLSNAIGCLFDINYGFHDRNWANFITSAEEEIKKRKEKIKANEKIEWLVESHTYFMRAYLEGKNNNHYINIIKKKAQELGVNLRFYNSKDSLARVVNTVRWPNYNFSRRKWEFINATRKGDLRISRFVYFGHGAYGSIVPNYPFKHHGYLGCGTLHNYAFSITGNDIKNGIFRKDVFIKSAIAISCSCRTSGKEKENEESFSSIWASYFGHVMYGLTGRMDYSNPKSPVPSNDPSAPSQWTPSNPFE